MNNKKSSSGLAKRTIIIIGGGGLGVFIFIFLVKFIKQVILNKFTKLSRLVPMGKIENIY